MPCRRTSLRTEAEAFLQALEIGLLDRTEVISWVDERIMAEEDPPAALIEASMSDGGDLNRLFSSLRRLPGPPDRAQTRTLLFALMRRALTAEPRHLRPIVRKLYSMAVAGDVPDEDAETTMYSLDDDLDHAEAGYLGSPEAVRQELEALLSRCGRDD